MKLLPIPGAPGYRIDCENHKAYSCKGGFIRPLTDRTAYRTLNIVIDGRTVGTTIWRLMYCAVNDIPLLSIPTLFCISFDHHAHKLVVREKKDLAKEASKVRMRQQRGRRRLDNVLANIRLVKKYYEGDTEPLINHLKQVEERESNRLQWMFGMGKDRAEMVTAQAVNVYLDELADGYPSYCIAKRVRELTKRENRALQCSRFEEWMQNKIIELP